MSHVFTWLIFFVKIYLLSDANNYFLKKVLILVIFLNFDDIYLCSREHGEKRSYRFYQLNA